MKLGVVSAGSEKGVGKKGIGAGFVIRSFLSAKAAESLKMRISGFRFWRGSSRSVTLCLANTDPGLWLAKNPIQVFEPLIRAHVLNGNRAPYEVTAALAPHG